MKVGIEFKINVADIDKARLYAGKKGTYLTLTSFVDMDNPDQYGNNGFITQKGEKGEKLPILGNSKVFWKEGGAMPQKATQNNAPTFDNDLDSLPF